MCVLSIPAPVHLQHIHIWNSIFSVTFSFLVTVILRIFTVLQCSAVDYCRTVTVLSIRCCSICSPLQPSSRTRTWITLRDLIKFMFYASVVLGQGETRGENESGEWFCIGSHFIWAVNIDSSELCWAGPGPGLIASPQHFPRVGDLTQIEMAAKVFHDIFRKFHFHI